MPGWFSAWFAYGLGARAARTVFGEERGTEGEGSGGPVRALTEEEIRADEKRFDEDERRLDAADAAAAKKHGAAG